MPNRYLRESFTESEAINSVSWQAEVTWTHLLVKVDDFGRCEANPKILRAKLFPLRLDTVRESDMPRLLAECEKAGLIRLYTANGKEYLEMAKWEKGRAEKSKFPDPPWHEQPLAAANKCGQPQTIPPTPTPTPTDSPIRAILPTLDQAKASATMAGVTAEAAECWWLECEARPLSPRGNFTDRDGNEIRKWLSHLTSYGRKWAANDARNSKTYGPNQKPDGRSNGPTSGAAKLRNT